MTDTLCAKLPNEISERVARAAIESAFTFFMVIFLFINEEDVCLRWE
nr:MAG TPA_asm: hypothetical protein [Caudoviricetes sp.]